MTLGMMLGLDLGRAGRRGVGVPTDGAPVPHETLGADVVHVHAGGNGTQLSRWFSAERS